MLLSGIEAADKYRRSVQAAAMIEGLVLG